MKQFLFISMALLTVNACWGQNTVVISQQGTGKQVATISQQGSNNSISINQSSTQAALHQPGTANQHPENRVSLRVDSTTHTTIEQQSDGSNVVDVSQNGLSTTTIIQSSAMHDNTVRQLTGQKPATPTNRSLKRPKRRY